MSESWVSFGSHTNITSPCIKIYVYSSVAWIEGTAILVAVFLVSGVGSFVDWRKEVAFLAVKLKQMEKNVVSPCSLKLLRALVRCIEEWKP